MCTQRRKVLKWLMLILDNQEKYDKNALYRQDSQNTT